jgi:hypothetical protein
MFVLSLVLGANAHAQRGVFNTVEALVSDYLPGATEQTLWLSQPARETAEAIWRRPLPLRTQYYRSADTTLWILNEVGKEQPMTIGVIIREQKIRAIRVLEYRESRGGEIRYDLFTRQFEALGLDAQHRLERNIDGISGATLSVRAMKKIANLALFLHQQVVVDAAESPEQNASIKKSPTKSD